MPSKRSCTHYLSNTSTEGFGLLVERVISYFTVGRGQNGGMANHTAAAVVLRDGDRERLTSMMRSTSGRAGQAQRAFIC